ncbi:uncharacterized protein LOC122614233 isoform X3 [Drosophila teissieri]|uniref:uncharacterized protein LOC122614233 isoform X3 n=1 Tax=Drosophila teissieri TaxID=7243 RepID=UPI001CB9FED8|nr:uncharacterized protein LOC122614233 isoform X3 [Drosophila teissieri]
MFFMATNLLHLRHSDPVVIHWRATSWPLMTMHHLRSSGNVVRLHPEYHPHRTVFHHHRSSSSKVT